MSLRDAWRAHTDAHANWRRFALCALPVVSGCLITGNVSAQTTPATSATASQGANAGIVSSAPAPDDIPSMSSAPTMSTGSPAAKTASSAPAISDNVQQIVVTARKHAEQLKDVPLAITAFTAQNLADAGATSLTDVAHLTPGLTLRENGAGYGTSVVIRGQANLNTGLSGGDPNVAIFLDGIYLADADAVQLGMLDMDRIEVVKGPVSALYGRNAYAGAINYVSAKPSNKFGFTASTEIGSYGRREIKAAVDIPIKPGILTTRISLGRDQSDGQWHDPVNGITGGGFKKNDADFAFTLTPTSKLTIEGGLYYGDDKYGVPANAAYANNCGTTYCGNLSYAKSAGIQESEVAGGTGNSMHTIAAHLKASYDLGWGDASALFGFNRVTENRYVNFSGYREGIPFQLSDGTTQNLNENFGGSTATTNQSLELRLASKQDQRLRLAGGMYLFNSRSDNTTLIGIDGSPLTAGQTLLPAYANFWLTPNGAYSTSHYSDSTGTDRVISEFLSADFDILPRLTLSLEGRYTLEEKSLDTIRGAFYTTTRPYGPIAQANFSFYNYRSNLRYKITNDAMVYASVANGTKAGGFNIGAPDAAELSYQPEKNTTFELGTKTAWFQHHLTADASVYHIEATNLQISGPSESGNAGLVTKNFGKATTNGFDLQLAAVPYRGVTLGAGFGYANPKFDSGTYDYSARDVANCALQSSCASRIKTVGSAAGQTQAIDLKGLNLPYASKETLDLSAQYQHALVGDWDWISRIDFRYESRQYATIDNFSYWGPRKLVNLRLGAENEHYSVTFFVNNVTDDQTPVGVIDNTQLNGTYNMLAYLPDRRFFGVQASYKF